MILYHEYQAGDRWKSCLLPVLLLMRTSTCEVFTETPQPTALFSGDSLVLEWMTSIPGREILWCYWQHQMAGAWDKFLGYNNQESKRLEISPRHVGWGFTNTGSPCHGGVQRANVTEYYSGVYVMNVGLYNNTEYQSTESRVLVVACPAPPSVTGASTHATMTTEHVHVTYTCQTAVPQSTAGDVTALWCDAAKGEWIGETPTCPVSGFSTLEITLIALLVCACVIIAVIVICMLMGKYHCLSKKAGDLEKGSVGVQGQEENVPLKDLGHTSDSHDSSDKPFEFIETFPAKTARENQTVVLSVRLSTETSVAWKRDGEKITKSDTRYKLTKCKGHRHKLTIQKATPDLAGDYTCLATNKGGKTDQHTENLFIITDDMRAPEFSEGLPDPLIVKAGDVTEHRAVITGNPTPGEVVCYKDDIPLADTDVISMTSSEDGHHVTVTLTFSRPKLSDSGTLHLAARNVLGVLPTIKCPIHVHMAPRFLTTLKDTRVGIDCEATFQIEVEGFPLPSVKWCRYKHESPQDVVSTEKSDDIRPYRLTSIATIPACTPDHEGLVQVWLTVGDQKYSRQANLRVNRSEGPSFLIKLKQTTVEVDGDAVFKTQFEGNPEPKAEWMINDQVVTSRDDLEILEPDKSNSQLTVKRCQLEDSCDVEVRVFHKYNSVTSTAKLIVEAIKPKFTLTPKDTRLIVGQEYTFRVEAEGKPPPGITWTSNGSCKEWELLADGGAHIKQAKLGHAGRYTIRASNPVGDTTRSFRVTVVESAPEYITPLRDGSFDFGSQATFRAVVKGVPCPSVEWYLGNSRLETGGRVHMRESTSDNALTCDLTISHCSHGDVGTIRLVAVNSVGWKESKAELNINKAPYFIVKPEPTNSYAVGDSFTLVVEFGGHPVPTVTWDFSGSSSRRPKIQTSNCKSVATFEKAKTSDTQEASVKIYNLHGEETHTFSIAVLGPVTMVTGNGNVREQVSHINNCGKTTSI